MTQLPDFNLEVYLGKWEFAARWHMTPSDAQTLTVKELLALADPADRAAWEELPLSYIETWGTPGLREAIAATYKMRLLTLFNRKAFTEILAEAGTPFDIHSDAMT